MFFSNLNQVMSKGVDLQITVSKNDADMIVMVMPKINGLNDPAQHQIIPLRFKGTADQIDANFIQCVAAPIHTSSNLLVNMEQFEKQAEVAAANSKSAKAEKEKSSKTDKEKREKYDSFIKKADEQEAGGKLSEALLNLKQARLHATDKAKESVDEKIKALGLKLNQGSLFDTPAVDTPAQQMVVETPVQQMAVQAPQQAMTQPQYQQPPVSMPQQQYQPPQPQVMPQPQQAAYQPQVVQQPQVAAIHQQSGILGFGAVTSEPMYNERDYGNIVDFPQEMLRSSNPAAPLF